LSVRQHIRVQTAKSIDCFKSEHTEALYAVPDGPRKPAATGVGGYKVLSQMYVYPQCNFSK